MTFPRRRASTVPTSKDKYSRDPSCSSSILSVQAWTSSWLLRIPQESYVSARTGTRQVYLHVQILTLPLHERLLDMITWQFRGQFRPTRASLPCSLHLWAPSLAHFHPFSSLDDFGLITSYQRTSLDHCVYHDLSLPLTISTIYPVLHQLVLIREKQTGTQNHATSDKDSGPCAGQLPCLAPLQQEHQT